MPARIETIGAQAAASSIELPSVKTAAELQQQTVSALSRRTPTIIAAAARELGAETIALSFNDGSSATEVRRFIPEQEPLRDASAAE